MAEQALKRIPKIYHEALWEERTIFKSTIKRTVEPYAMALKDNNKVLLSKVFYTTIEDRKIITIFLGVYFNSAYKFRQKQTKNSIAKSD